MCHRFHLVLLVSLVMAAPLAAQETPPDTTRPAPSDTTAPVPAPPDTVAPVPDAPAPPDQPAPTPPDTAAAAAGDTAAAGPTHDWEFSLVPKERTPGAGGIVQVTDGDPSNAFVVQVTGLPPIDSLDQEGRDVGAYTVWVVPSKDRVQESTLAGVIAVDAAGAGRFEGSTELDSFGIMILASPEGTTTLNGMAVLTGIPVSQAEPADETPDEEAPETPDDEAPETPDETPDAPAPDAPAPDNPPAPAPPTPQPETPQPETPQPVPPQPETPPGPGTPSSTSGR